MALVGENGAGKTNVLEAISLFMPGRGLRRAELADMARDEGPGSFAVSVTLDAPYGEHRLGTGARMKPRAARRPRLTGLPHRRHAGFLAHGVCRIPARRLAHP